MLVIALTSNNTKAQNEKMKYPETRKGDVVDDYFGTQVSDPYRWLEDDRSPETEAWVVEQNKVTKMMGSRTSMSFTGKKEIRILRSSSIRTSSLRTEPPL